MTNEELQMKTMTTSLSLEFLTNLQTIVVVPVTVVSSLALIAEIWD